MQITKAMDIIFLTHHGYMSKCIIKLLKPQLIVSNGYLSLI